MGHSLGALSWGILLVPSLGPLLGLVGFLRALRGLCGPAPGLFCVWRPWWRVFGAFLALGAPCSRPRSSTSGGSPKRATQLEAVHDRRLSEPPRELSQESHARVSVARGPMGARKVLDARVQELARQATWSSAAPGCASTVFSARPKAFEATMVITWGDRRAGVAREWRWSRAALSGHRASQELTSPCRPRSLRGGQLRQVPVEGPSGRSP